ncbi:MAG: hypothetical protein LBP37_07480 [Spirochaetaceae bacterium]|nr:hypothetical protein [Spirochaetaceae bacterium]
MEWFGMMELPDYNVGNYHIFDGLVKMGCLVSRKYIHFGEFCRYRRSDTVLKYYGP